MAFSGDSDAVDKQPGQRQCDGQQQPRPQPPGQKNPHAQRPFFFFFSRPEAGPWPPALMCGTSYPIELCLSGVAGSQVGRTAGHVSIGLYGYPPRGVLTTAPARLVLARARERDGSA